MTVQATSYGAGSRTRTSAQSQMSPAAQEPRRTSAAATDSRPSVFVAAGPAPSAEDGGTTGRLVDLKL